MRAFAIVLFVLLAVLPAGCCTTSTDLDRRIQELEAENKALRNQLDSMPRYPKIKVESRLEFGPQKSPETAPAPSGGAYGMMGGEEMR